MSDDLVNAVDDLIRQATVERSHYYTGNVLRLCKARIEALTAENAEMKTKLGNVRARSNRQRTSLANMEATNRRYKEEAKGAQRAVSGKAAEIELLKAALKYEGGPWRFWSDRARGLAAENANLRALTEWQDISTAPRDGTPFIAYEAGRPEYDIYKCWWQEDFSNWSGWQDDWDSEPSPTHWRVYQEPPK